MTRDRKELPAEWNGRAFTLVDTGGVDLEDSDELSGSIRDQSRAALADAAVVVLVVDARAGLRPGDAELADLLRRSDMPALVAANKCDGAGDVPQAAEFHGWAWASRSRFRPCTAWAPGDLLDAVVERLPEASPRRRPTRRVRLAVIGRPNVGKSSLVNRFLRRERVIVSDRAGTTRDAIDERLEVDGRPVMLVDTAGIRRQSKVAYARGRVEYYTALRSRRAAERADVAIVVCDAATGSRRRTCASPSWRCRAAAPPSRAQQVGRRAGGLRPRPRARARQHQAPPAPPRAHGERASGRHVDRLMTEALALADRRAGRIPTPELNRFLGDVVAARQPPQRQGKRLNLLYMAQTGTAPPRFTIQVNARRLIVRDWAYFLENRLRERYRLDGVPLVIDFVERRRRRSESGRRSGAGARRA